MILQYSCSVLVQGEIYWGIQSAMGPTLTLNKEAVSVEEPTHRDDGPPVVVLQQTSPAGPPEPRRLEAPAAVLVSGLSSMSHMNQTHLTELANLFQKVSRKHSPPGNGCGDYRAGRPLDNESWSLKMGNSVVLPVKMLV